MLGFHTINARDNALLHYIFLQLADSDPRHFQHAMQQEAGQIRSLLGSCGIRYEDLKSSLVPTREGIQAVFLYDWWEDPFWNYAVAFANRYLPCLRKDLRTSMLDGDLLGTAPIAAMESTLTRAHSHPVSWQTQYAVYFNNLRSGDVERLHGELSKEPRYTGYIDVSFASPIRDFLARATTPRWVLLGNYIIMANDDGSPASQEDPVGFGLPAHGYEVVSLMDSHFTGFLSYQIEATNAPRAVDDRILNLAAITGELIDTESAEIFVHPSKLDKYLLLDENKLRLMTKIGLQEVGPDGLASIIRTKLAQNYIYDLRFGSEGTPLFAVSAEFEVPGGGLTRRLLALKHDKDRRAISLVSMY